MPERRPLTVRRTGTYVAFHAGGTSNPAMSDMKYYRMLTAWHENEDIDFRLVNSHEKAAAVRDGSSKDRLRVVLSERLRLSKNMVLILTHGTKWDKDWVPFEIAYAIDRCKLPIIAAYPGYRYIGAPSQLASFWPLALRLRILNGTAHVIHVPFMQEPLKDAIAQFSPDRYPVGGGYTRYSPEAYRSFGIQP